MLPASSKLPLPLALTMGDPAGIGPEITQKAWYATRNQTDISFFVIGDPKLYPKSIEIDHPKSAIDAFKFALPVLPIECPSVALGKPNANAATAILTSIKMGVKLALDGQCSALVTNPIAKDVLYRSGFRFAGHTEFLANLTKTIDAPYQNGPVMMLSAKDLRIALATIHIPLKDVACAISIDSVKKIVRVVHGALQTDFGLPNPKIAMAGLNPHAGENGSIGREEMDILIPAAQLLRNEGINIGNPQSADTLFHEEARTGYDAALTMYHDQGLIPVKTLDFHGGVNTTLGLPIIRTSPDHGTAFDIATKFNARPDSLLAAIKAAHSMARYRSYAVGQHG